MSDDDPDSVIAGLGSLSSKKQEGDKSKEDKSEQKDEQEMVQSALKSQNVSIVVTRPNFPRHEVAVPAET